jgi:hypothetical protein
MLHMSLGPGIERSLMGRKIMRHSGVGEQAISTTERSSGRVGHSTRSCPGLGTAYPEHEAIQAVGRQDVIDGDPAELLVTDRDRDDIVTI